MNTANEIAMAGLPEPEMLPSGDERFRANAHIHLPPNFSAFSHPEEAVTLAAQQGVRVLGGSNYYDYSVYRAFADAARKAHVFPLFGLEIITLDQSLQESGIKINDPGNPGKFYVCGKGITEFDPMNAEAQALLDVIRERDSERMTAMTARLSERLMAAGGSVDLTAAGIRDTLAARYGCPAETVFLQERHVAQAIQEAIFSTVSEEERPAFLERFYGAAAKGDPTRPAAVQNDIRSLLMKAGKPAYVPETFVSFEHAIRLILALGGIPCYPALLDGANPICGFETPVDALTQRLLDRGFTCAELIPTRNRAEALSDYVPALRNAGILVTAGTEHNTPERTPIVPTCLGGEPIPEPVETIFREGTCVLAAHQYRRSRGESGFVDRNGLPNPDFRTSEERIAAFRDLGQRLISAY
ncbi:MAG: hypothetical protein SFU56_04560 [Capsulimonadales bacterium]|nr:hypothetical protein [Capsulimonadales bacterium]